VSACEVWGTKSILDPLSKFFQEIFHNLGLVDIVPLKYVPSWSNGRGGIKRIGKIIDKVFILEDLVSSVRRYKTWVVYPSFQITL